MIFCEQYAHLATLPGRKSICQKWHHTQFKGSDPAASPPELAPASYIVAQEPDEPASQITHMQPLKVGCAAIVRSSHHTQGALARKEGGVQINCGPRHFPYIKILSYSSTSI